MCFALRNIWCGIKQSRRSNFIISRLSVTSNVPTRYCASPYNPQPVKLLGKPSGLWKTIDLCCLYIFPVQTADFHTTRKACFRTWAPKSVTVASYIQHYDNTFTESGFLEGAIAQLAYVSSHIAKGELWELTQAVTTAELDRIARRLSYLKEEEKEYLQIYPDDITSSRIHSLVIFDGPFLIKDVPKDSKYRPRPTYLEIPVSIVGIHKRYVTEVTKQAENKKLMIYDRVPRFFCRYAFRKQILPRAEFDIEAAWVVSKVLHGRGVLSRTV